MKDLIYLRELISDPAGCYYREWYCASPAPYQRFRVSREQWFPGYGSFDAQKIYEWVPDYAGYPGISPQPLKIVMRDE